MSKIEVQAASKKAMLRITGPITDKTSVQFQAELDKLAEAGVRTLDIHVNSPGGDVFAGSEMRNAIKDFEGAVNMHAGALVASAATLLFCTKKGQRTAKKNSMFMIHKPWISRGGNEDELEANLEFIKKLKPGIIEAYTSVTGKPEDEISAILDKGETWFTADEAVAFGLIDGVDPEAVMIHQEDIAGLEQAGIEAPEALVKLFKNQQQSDMKKIAMMAAALAVANDAFDTDNATEDSVVAEAQNQANELVSLRAKVKGLEAKEAELETMKAAQAEAEKATRVAMINEAKTAGKISEVQAGHFTKLAETDEGFASVKAILDSIEAHQPIHARLTAEKPEEGKGFEGKTYAELASTKEGSKYLEGLAVNNPTAFAELKDAHIKSLRS